ncbi:NUDIX domain-containing protein [Mesorhizobium sp. NBSH29]|uniref:NUDIX hydrolase n=1 Tax=Mesorhizobium sp. NBSH29 TaxID=2654249 RepID=UPI001896675D|nr:NUDIX hydrolase [Mesorhizobium sp. NBSH29]QPC88037.1 NUDIX domain-containing protein [Mesorhizobium sp. NBSH29]
MMVSHTTRNRIAERVRILFGGKPCRLQVAALPWKRVSGQTKIMMITSRDTGRWVLPKGWPEGREQLYDTAAREAGEEAGLVGNIAQTHFGSYFYGKVLATGMEQRCEVLVFPMKISKTVTNWPEKEERTRKWFSPDDAARSVAEVDLGELITRFAASHQFTA